MTRILAPTVKIKVLIHNCQNSYTHGFVQHQLKFIVKLRSTETLSVTEYGSKGTKKCGPSWSMQEVRGGE